MTATKPHTQKAGMGMTPLRLFHFCDVVRSVEVFAVPAQRSDY